jgi:hypothetical protein
VRMTGDEYVSVDVVVAFAVSQNHSCQVHTRRASRCGRRDVLPWHSVVSQKQKPFSSKSSPRNVRAETIGFGWKLMSAILT